MTTLYFLQFSNGQTSITTEGLSVMHSGQEPINTVTFTVDNSIATDMLDNPTTYSFSFVNGSLSWEKI